MADRHDVALKSRTQRLVALLRSSSAINPTETSRLAGLFRQNALLSHFIDHMSTIVVRICIKPWLNQSVSPDSFRVIAYRSNSTKLVRSLTTAASGLLTKMAKEPR
jgi:hypothetical protein